jgi:hypothetical protein
LPQTFWTIVRSRNTRLEVLIIDRNDEKTLSVFTFKEEAEVFLGLGGMETAGYQIRETSTGELVSMLCGPCRDAGTVLLDPPPEFCGEALLDLVSLSRRRFLQTLASERRGSLPFSAEAA